MSASDPLPEHAKRDRVTAEGGCACGAVRLQIDVPAVWAWHDHSEASRRAHGTAYSTYVGSWKSKFRVLQGEEHVTRYHDTEHGTVRGFCARCGTPLTYERPRAPQIVNIPRGVFTGRTGRDTRYHMFLGEVADWTYLGEPLGPVKGYPGLMRERPRKKKQRPEGMF